MTAIVGSAPPTVLQFFDNRGNPAAGGSVLTQVGGVNYATYQDSGGATPLPNPIPLNSRGEVSNASGVSCQLFLVSGVTYTFTLYDAAGNQLNQATSVQALISQGSLSASSGASLIGWIYAFGSAVAATVQNWISWQNVNTFGFMTVAQIADVQANTASIDVTSAINSAWACVGRTVKMPAGSYLLASNPNPPTCGQIIGDGIDNTTLVAKTGVTKALQLMGGFGNPSFVGPVYAGHFSIRGNATTNAVGIEIGKSTGSGAGVLSYDHATIDKVRVYDFTGTGAVGWALWDMNFTSIYDPVSYNNTVNMVCDKTNYAGTTPANVSVYNMINQSSGGIGLIVYQGGINFHDPNFLGSTNAAVSVLTSLGNAPPGNVTLKLYKPHFEGISAGDVTKWCVSVTGTTGAAYVIITDPEVQGGGATFAKFLAATGADALVSIRGLACNGANQTDWINADTNAKIVVGSDYGQIDNPYVALRTLVTLASGAKLIGASMVNTSAAITATCGTSGTITMNANLLTFVKDGAKVTISGQLTVTSVSSPVGTLTFGPLPYACSNLTGAWCALTVYSDVMSATATTAMQGYIGANSSSIVIQHFAAGAGGNAAADIKAGSTIIVNGTYFTDL